MKNRWYILGAGSIGNLWGCNFSYMGYPVTLVLRNQDKLEKFHAAEQRLKLSEHLYFVDAELADSPETINQLLVTTKSTDTKAAINSIKHRITEDAKIIVLQNGMGSQDWISDNFPSAQVAWASTTDGAWLSDDFTVNHAGKGITRIGSPTSVYPWIEQLGCGFLTVELDDDIHATLWRKLAINCSINPLTALFDCQNGELINNPDYLTEMASICREVESVATAVGIELFDGPLIENACQVAELTAKNYSSMLQDIRQNRQTEIENITGYLCRLAEAEGVSVPTNQKYLKKIRELENNSG